jgi:hypothetical protein
MILEEVFEDFASDFADFDEKFSLKLTDGILSVYLQKVSIPLTRTDIFGRNLFHYCAMRGFTKSVENLLGEEEFEFAILESPDCFGFTPLDYTLRGGFVDLHQTFIEVGAKSRYYSKLQDDGAIDDLEEKLSVISLKDSTGSLGVNNWESSSSAESSEEFELKKRADLALQKFEISGDLRSKIDMAPKAPDISEFKEFKRLMEKAPSPSQVAKKKNASVRSLKSESSPPIEITEEKEAMRKKIVDKKREIKLKKLKGEEDELKRLYDDYTPVDSAAEMRLKVEARKRMLLNNRNNAANNNARILQQPPIDPEEIKRRIERRKAEILMERRKLESSDSDA